MAELRDNPIQTDGFEFVEYAVPDPRALGELFERLGFQAFWRGDAPGPAGAGLRYVDHLTHNVHRGRMKEWAEFYERLFGFREIRYFDIEGQLTGLKSKAMTSPCGKIRIPINESSDDRSQIQEYLEEYHGEGIQHIALHTADIYATVDRLRAAGVQLLDTPDTYYEMVGKRLPDHGEPLEELHKRRILIDGSPSGGLLLQIFTKTAIGPIFFEIIQRKGDEGFGEGNFKALFESMELDQVRRGVLKPAALRAAVEAGAALRLQRMDRRHREAGFGARNSALRQGLAAAEGEDRLGDRRRAGPHPRRRLLHPSRQPALSGHRVAAPPRGVRLHRRARRVPRFLRARAAAFRPDLCRSPVRVRQGRPEGDAPRRGQDARAPVLVHDRVRPDADRFGHPGVRRGIVVLGRRARLLRRRPAPAPARVRPRAHHAHRIPDRPLPGDLLLHRFVRAPDARNGARLHADLRPDS